MHSAIRVHCKILVLHVLVLTYLLVIFEWPFSHPRTSTRSSLRCQKCWNDKRTKSGQPWNGHANSSHPRAIALAMKDCMDNFEVTLQGDDHKTDLCGVDTRKTVWSKLMLPVPISYRRTVNKSTTDHFSSQLHITIRQPDRSLRRSWTQSTALCCVTESIRYCFRPGRASCSSAELRETRGRRRW